jgi:hypothetical protein
VRLPGYATLVIGDHCKCYFVTLPSVNMSEIKSRKHARGKALVTDLRAAGYAAAMRMDIDRAAEV